MELQTVFYVMGIVFMTIMFILMLAVVIAVFVIRAKIVAIHKHIEEKMNQVTAITDKGKALLGIFARVKALKHLRR